MTFQTQNHVTSRISDGHIRYTKFEHFGVIGFWVMLRTNRQTDSFERPTRLCWGHLGFGPSALYKMVKQYDVLTRLSGPRDKGHWGRIQQGLSPCMSDIMSIVQARIARLRWLGAAKILGGNS